MIKSIPTLVREVLSMQMQVGETNRLVHEFQSDGTPCSVDKDPCLNVTRAKNGFKYFCHRCHEQGYFPVETMSPEQTAALVGRIQYPVEEDSLDEDGFFDLPSDCIDMVLHPDNEVYTWNQVNVSFDALKWLWSYSVFDEQKVWELDLRWSPKYRRLIFPMYSDDGEVFGWVGRDVVGTPGLPKWLTRKSPNYNDRLLFTVQGEGKIVWVEDCVSAMRVNKATGFTAIALLTTTTNYGICHEFKDYPQILWLDGDMKTKMVKTVMKMRSLGMDLKMQYSTLDPKEYTDVEIRERIGYYEELDSDTGE